LDITFIVKEIGIFTVQSGTYLAKSL
jgi:hypothetical protein